MTKKRYDALTHLVSSVKSLVSRSSASINYGALPDRLLHTVNCFRGVMTLHQPTGAFSYSAVVVAENRISGTCSDVAISGSSLQ